METLVSLFPEKAAFLGVVENILRWEENSQNIADELYSFLRSSGYSSVSPLERVLSLFKLLEFYGKDSKFLKHHTHYAFSTVCYYELRDFGDKATLKLVYYFLFKWIQECDLAVNFGDINIASPRSTDTKIAITSEEWPSSVQTRITEYQSGILYLHETNRHSRVWTFTDELEFSYLDAGRIFNIIDQFVTFNDINYTERFLTVDTHFHVDKCECGCFKYIENTQCVECTKTLLPTGQIINEYSTRVPTFLEPQFEKAEKITYGLEIEVERGGGDRKVLESSALELYKVGKKYLLCKRDGSINDGCEIVTIPATFSVHKKRLIDLSKALVDNGFYTADNCGVHIHVGKQHLSALQLGKISTFIYEDGNKSLIESIAGRSGNYFCNYNGDSNLYSFSPENFKNKSGNRYSAINISNKHTIEFRIFASAVKYSQLMRYLEFVDSLIKFTYPANKPITHLKEREQFLMFIKASNIYNVAARKKEKEFPHLLSFLQEAGFIKASGRKAV